MTAHVQQKMAHFWDCGALAKVSTIATPLSLCSAHNCESSRACYAAYSKCGCGAFVATYFDAYHRYVQKHWFIHVYYKKVIRCCHETAV